MWQSEDGVLFDKKKDALMHEARADEIRYFETIGIHGMFERGEDVVNLLDDYRERILKYYGVEENRLE